MINLGEDELICDLAETYNLFIPSFTSEKLIDTQGRELLPSLVATLACGLSGNSRIKRKISNRTLDLNETLLAIIADRLGIIAWQRSKDGYKNRNRPKSIFEMLVGQDKKKDELEIFESQESFDEWYKRTRT